MIVELTPNELAGIEHANASYRQLREPGVDLVVPYLMFDAFLDIETRLNHCVLDGGIAPVGWKGWNRCAPPLGKLCRCNAISLTQSEARRRLGEGGRYFDLTTRIPEGAGLDADWLRHEDWWETGQSCGPWEWIEVPDTPRFIRDITVDESVQAAEYFAHFASAIRMTPGIIQTELYSLFPDWPPQDISNVLYYAARCGLVLRKKRGRTYELSLPS
jgi:hypothetical protein